MLASLTALDLDSDRVTFALESGEDEMVDINIYLEVRRTGDKTTDLVLKAPLDYEVRARETGTGTENNDRVSFI